MIRSFRRSMLYSFLVLAIGAAGLAVSASTASAAPTTCGGVVFHDFDADGERSEDYSFVSAEYAAVDDDGVAGIDVLVTAANGSSFSTTTGADGVWSVALDTNDFPIRVDFSGLPTGWNPTPNGSDSASLNQFIASASECGVGAVGNAGIAAPGTFCENRPELVTSCFLFGNVAGHDDMAAVVSLIDGASDNGGTTGSGWQDDPYTVRATLGEVGTVYGMDSTPDGAVYVGSFVKRHAQLGPTDNPTTIYRIVGNTSSAWFTTDPAAVDPHSGDVDGWLNDYAAFDDVGRQGLGDVEISPDNRTLYTVDLGQKQLVAIPINADGSANSGGVVRTNITASSLGVSSCADSDIRPFALGWSADDQLLVGATCSGESSVSLADGPVDEVTGPHLGDKGQLASWIFSFDGSFTKLMDVPLPTTSRGSQNGQNDPASTNYFRGQSDWRPWVPQAPFAADMTGWPAGGVAYAQPLMADIEPDGDDYIIGFMDIWAHQVGSNSTYQHDGVSYDIDQPISSGDTLRAVSSGAGWTFPTSGVDFFYDEDNYGGSHTETTLGSAVQIPGRPYAITNSFDPINGSNTWQSGGLEWHANEDFGTIGAGEHVTGYRLYDGRAGLAVGTFEKAAGIGDVQALCGVADIEVGNRVWFDADADGIADPAEAAMAGVEIELVDSGGTVISTTSTDAAGLYTFNSATIAAFVVGADYSVRIAQSNYDAGGVYATGGTYENQGFPTFSNVGADDGNDNDAVSIAGLPTIAFTAAASDHTLDFGMSEPTLRLGNTVWLDADNDGVQNGAESGIEGVEVQLWSVDGAGNPVALIGSDTTGVAGDYTFENLMPGDYVVAVSDTEQSVGRPLAGLGSTSGNGVAPDPDDDVDLDDNGDPAAGFASISAPVTLRPASEPTGEAGEGGWADDESNYTVDFGFTTRYRLGNIVWLDADNDGIADAGESPISGVEVQLWTADGAGAPVAQIAMATTDVDGMYDFSNLEPGDYVVAIADTQQGAGQALEGVVSSTGNDPASDPDDGVNNDDDGTPSPGFAAISAAVSLDGATPSAESNGLTGTTEEDGSWADAASDQTIDFGFTGPLRLGSTVFLDEDGNGSQNGSEPGIDGVNVDLWSTDGAGNPVAIVQSTTTNPAGTYLFENLRPGDYVVAVADTEQAVGEPLMGLGSTSGNGVAPDPDDDVDLDDNGDGAPGFATISAPVTLAAGSEPAGEVLEGGWVDADSNLTVDFGFVEGLRLGNLVFEDLDDDGVADRGEPGLAGVTVQLWSVDAGGNPLTELTSTTTDVDGHYSFEGLTPGRYIVAVPDTDQAVGGSLENLVSADGNGVAPGPDDNADNDDNGDPAPGFASISSAVTLSSNAEPLGETLRSDDPSLDETAGVDDNDSNLTVDLGFERRYRLGNTVWLDTNNNGTQEAGEAGIVGVEMQLWSVDGAGNPDTQLDTVTTIADGRYSFSDLEAADYVVAIAETQQQAGQTLDGLRSSDGNGVAPDPDDDVDLDDNGDPAVGFASISTAITLGGSEPIGESGEDGNWTDGSSNYTVDFGFVGALRLGSTVFLDVNGNGVDGAIDTPLPGVEVQLWTVDGAGNPDTQIATDTTDAAGEYAFEYLAPGDYIVAIADTEQAAGQGLEGLGSTSGNGVAPDPDDGVDLDDNGDAAPGFASISRPVTLSSGSEPSGESNEGGWVDADSNLTVDFGFVRSYRLGNTVFFDADNSGSQDVGEPGILGVEVQLWSVDGGGNPVALLATDTTDASGEYLFENLDAGDYIVAIADTQALVGAPLQDLLSSDGNGVAPDPDDDVDADDNGDPTTGFASISQAVTLGGNEPTGEADEGGWPDASSNLTVDFGFRGQLRLGSTVFIDEDGSGAQGAGEPGVSGVEVQLWSVDNVDAPLALIATTTTGTDGYYAFEYLIAGDYIVAIADTQQLAGQALEGLGSTSGNGAAPDPDDDVDLDDNGDAAPGFASIAQPVLLTVGAEPRGEANEASWVDEDSNLTVDFGFVRSYRLGNTVWLDDDNDGLRDAGEVGIQGVEVQLWSVDGRGNPVSLLATDTTDAAGEYLFEGLEPRDYIVAVPDTEQLVGNALADLVSSTGNGTATDPDDDVDLDDDGDPVAGFAAIAAPVTLGGVEPTGEAGEGGWVDAESNLSVDFGFVRLYRLGDTVFLDVDNSGSQDAGEPGISGVEVQLWSADGAGNPVAQLGTDTTDGAGAYLFEDLDAGDYIVAVADTEAAVGSALEGLISSTGNGAAPDPDDGVDLDDNGDAAPGFASISHAVTIAPAGPTGEVTEDGSWADSLSNLTVDFGFTGPMRLGSTVFLDADGDGSQSAGEPGITGVDVQLWSVDNADQPLSLIATTTTAVDGYYVFENLIPADYIVAIPDTEQGVGQELDGLGSTSGNGVAPDPDDDVDLDDNGDPVAGFASMSAPMTLVRGGEALGEVNEAGWVDGDSNLTVDFGFVEGLRLGNLVFEDLDDDGVADSGEPGIEGVEVQLWSADAGGAPVAEIASVLTDIDGHYSFAGLTPGDYVLAIPVSDQATGGVLENLVSADGNGSATDPDDNVDNDDDGDVSAGFASISAAVTLTSNIEPTGETLRSNDGTSDEDGVLADDDSNLTIDFGFERRYRVGNLVWFDANNDGSADAGETPLPGVEVELWTADAGGAPATFVTSATTDAAGHYVFEDLERGDYVVAIPDSEQAVGAPLEGYVESTGIDPATDPDDGLDNDDDGAAQVGFASLSLAFTLGDTSLIPTGERDGLTGAPDENGSWLDSSSNLTIDFGFIGSLRLGSTVWRDQNGDGVQNPGEPAIVGVEVQLWSVDASGNPDAQLATTTTDGSGNYEFAHLIDGDYIVAIPDTQQAAGLPLEGLGSTMGNGAAPDPDDDVDLDDNGDAAPGFASISAPVTLAGGTEPSSEAHEGAWVDVDSNFSVDFGFAAGLELGNVVFVDDDNDGVQDAGEPQIPDVTLELVNNAGEVVATTITDAAGNYVFSNIAPATYSVRIPAREFADGAPLAGWHPSTGAGVSADADDDVDANSDRSSGIDAVADGVVSGPVTLVSGSEPTGEPEASPGGLADADSNLTVDFGFYQVSLGNYVWFDDDNDGLFDPSERPAAGVVLELFDEAGDPVAGPDGEPMVATTDANGEYSFDGLPEGTYVVGIPAVNFVEGAVLYDVVTSTGNNNGTGSAPDPDDDVDLDDNGNFVLGGGATSQPIVLAAGLEPGGNVNTTVDFGFTPAAGLGSLVWFDNDRDGVQDTGERGVPDVVVTVIHVPSGQVYGTDTTDSTGNWSVTGLPPGDYTVVFDDPLNRTFTSIDRGDDALDSDATPAGETGVVNLSAGEYDPTVDAGILPPPITIGQIALTGSTLTAALLAWGIGAAFIGWALVLLGREPEENPYLV